MKTTRNALFILLLSLVLWLVIMPLRGHYIPFIDFRISTLIYAICFFFFTGWMLQKYKEELKALHILLLILLGCALPEMVFYAIDFADTLKTLPDLICRMISVGVAYGIAISERKQRKYLFIGGVVSIAFLVYMEGAEWWLEWCRHL
ncbi:MAG: hypothetical protein LBM06_07240 [Prevotellaceae bacterium]|jgi:hypothetical protein|nr:hypothetical protein [Prevotellaceae bacterium]